MSNVLPTVGLGLILDSVRESNTDQIADGKNCYWLIIPFAVQTVRYGWPVYALHTRIITSRKLLFSGSIRHALNASCALCVVQCGSTAPTHIHSLVARQRLAMRLCVYVCGFTGGEPIRIAWQAGRLVRIVIGENGRSALCVYLLCMYVYRQKCHLHAVCMLVVVMYNVYVFVVVIWI